MSGAREYVINYGSLPFGEHEFEFHVSDSFFQKFENSLVQKGDIDVLVVLDKSEEVIVVSTKEYELDVSQFIYEYISLQLPMRNVHDEEENGQTCDPEILKALEKLQPQQEETPPEDPRWDGLKGINLN